MRPPKKYENLVCRNCGSGRPWCRCPGGYVPAADAPAPAPEQPPPTAPEAPEAECVCGHSEGVHGSAGNRLCGAGRCGCPGFKTSAAAIEGYEDRMASPIAEAHGKRDTAAVEEIFRKIADCPSCAHPVALHGEWGCRLGREEGFSWKVGEGCRCLRRWYDDGTPMAPAVPPPEGAEVAASIDRKAATKPQACHRCERKLSEVELLMWARSAQGTPGLCARCWGVAGRARKDPAAEAGATPPVGRPPDRALDADIAVVSIAVASMAANVTGANVFDGAWERIKARLRGDAQPSATPSASRGEDAPDGRGK